MRTRKQARIDLENRFKEKGIEMRSMFLGSSKRMLLGCLKCGYEWEGQPREVERSKVSGCRKCASIANRRPNEIVSECGPFLVLDVSTPSKKSVMLINKKKWELLERGNIGRVRLCPKGYPKAVWKGKNEFVHRIVMGFPKLVDHINGVKHDNRMCNLREVTEIQSQMNRGLRKTNKSGVIGVHEKKPGVWEACLKVGRKRVHQSSHKSLEAAAAARAEAGREHCGEFAPPAVKTEPIEMVSIHTGKMDSIHREMWENGGAVGEWKDGLPVYGMWKV